MFSVENASVVQYIEANRRHSAAKNAAYAEELSEVVITNRGAVHLCITLSLQQER